MIFHGSVNPTLHLRFPPGVNPLTAVPYRHQMAGDRKRRPGAVAGSAQIARRRVVASLILAAA
jgi:hypothetical protein